MVHEYIRFRRTDQGRRRNTQFVSFAALDENYPSGTESSGGFQPIRCVGVSDSNKPTGISDQKPGFLMTLV
jgi:hypothetical protein